MRPSTSLLIKVKPLPASVLSSVRLPPLASTTKTKTDAVSFKAQQETVAQYLTRKATESPDEWPSNLRVEEAVNKKDLFWKVPKAQRDVLKKQLREA